MQLIRATTEKRYVPSTKYLKLSSPAIERFESKPEQLLILRHGFFAPVSIPEFYSTEELTETSKTLQPLRLIEKLEDLYTFDNPKEIKNFLLTNDYLIEILFEASDHIYRIFGQFPIHLELHRDPEEGWDELFIVIKSTYSAEESIRLENRLAEEWFLNRIKDTRGKLNITEEPL
ncbi:MAG: hypothetical protein AB1488_07695 [Nitrospirota bacterium]